MNTLISLGMTREKQSMMEKGIKGEDVLRKQKAVIQELSKKRVTSKTGAAAR